MPTKKTLVLPAAAAGGLVKHIVYAGLHVQNSSFTESCGLVLAGEPDVWTLLSPAVALVLREPCITRAHGEVSDSGVNARNVPVPASSRVIARARSAKTEV